MAGRPAVVRSLLGAGEQPRADALAPPIGLDAQDFEYAVAASASSSQPHLDEADQPVAVERAESRCYRVNSAPAQVLQHLLRPAGQVGGPQRLDVEASQERHVGGQLGVVGCADAVGDRGSDGCRRS